MIAVIADDLTGAAELAGIGLHYGLNVEISVGINSLSKADLLVIATDARSLKCIEAVDEMVAASNAVMNLSPDFIYKKIDSVLRGYIVPEIKAQLEVLGFKKALLLPANPALGRTIENGQYLIDGRPISETAFSHDPEFPARYSDVLQILGNDKSLSVRKCSDTELSRITIGEVKSESDLDEWVKVSRPEVLFAGGSGFFSAMLRKLGLASVSSKQSDHQLNGAMLYVFGSAFSKSAELVQQLLQNGEPIYYLPESLMLSQNITNELEYSIGEIVTLFKANGKAHIAVDPQLPRLLTALDLRNLMAVIVSAIYKKVEINELVIEGGSTASAILKKLKIEALQPINEYATGVIRSKVMGKENLYVTLKPGSYSWPDQILTP